MKPDNTHGIYYIIDKSSSALHHSEDPEQFSALFGGHNKSEPPDYRAIVVMFIFLEVIHAQTFFRSHNTLIVSS